MATNPLAVRNSGLNVFDLDRRTQRELVTQSNRMHAQNELARAAMNAMSEVYVYSEYQSSLAAIATQAIEDNLAAAGIPPNEYLAYNRMMRHEYLQQMAMVTYKAMNGINRLIE
jgi:hypothetical protein